MPALVAKEYYTCEEVASLFRVTRETIRVWAKEGVDTRTGRFPNAIKPGRKYLIPRGDIQSFLQDQHGDPNAE